MNLKEALEAIKKDAIKLNLMGEYIGDEGAKEIAEGLKNNTTVTTLHLGINQIGDDGAKVFAGMLKVNKTLTFLDLRRNKIEDEGIQALLEALEINTSITICYLDVEPDESKKLDVILSRNKKLQEERTKIAEEKEYLIAKFKQENEKLDESQLKASQEEDNADTLKGDDFLPSSDGDPEKSGLSGATDPRDSD